MRVSHKIGHFSTTIGWLAFVSGCAASAGNEDFGAPPNAGGIGSSSAAGGSGAKGGASSASGGSKASGGSGGTSGLGSGGQIPLDPCSDGSADCDENATCSGSSNGSYQCACKPGYAGDGKQCEKTACDPIENFDGGSWPHLPWAPEGGGKSTVGADAAHDGAAGLVETEWMINQFVSVGAPGERLTAWVRGDGGGRAYLGFGSTPKGTKALVYAANANSLILNDVPSFYTFVDVETASMPLSIGAWKKLEIEFGSGGSVTGRLYDSNGGSLIATVTHTFSDLVPGGVAIRAFNSTYIDTIEVCRTK